MYLGTCRRRVTTRLIRRTNDENSWMKQDVEKEKAKGKK